MQAGKNIKAVELFDKDKEHPYPCYGGNGIRGYMNRYNNEGTFPIVGRQGALCGNINMACGQFYATEHAVVTDTLGITNPYWAQWFLMALNLNQYATATAQPGLAVSNIIEVLIPLPPFNEQQRIVDKLNLSISLVDKYDDVNCRLYMLNNNIQHQLKKSILQQAIQGLLVEQNSDDEPVSVLLEKIKTEKERLIKEKKIKRDKQDSIIYRDDDNKYWEKRGNENLCIDDEIPFDLPSSWQWVRFGSIVKMRIGKTPPRGDVNYWSNGTTPWISISDMSDYGFIEKTKEQVSDFAIESAFGNNIVPAGTLIMSFKLTVGRTSIINIDAVHNEAIISIIPYIDNDHSLRDYLFYILPLIANLGDSKDAIKGKTLNSSSLYNLLIPLPPLSEQKRIINAIITAWQVL